MDTMVKDLSIRVRGLSASCSFVMIIRMSSLYRRKWIANTRTATCKLSTRRESSTPLHWHRIPKLTGFWMQSGPRPTTSVICIVDILFLLSIVSEPVLFHSSTSFVVKTSATSVSRCVPRSLSLLRCVVTGLADISATLSSSSFSSQNNFFAIPKPSRSSRRWSARHSSSVIFPSPIPRNSLLLRRSSVISSAVVCA